MSKSSLKRKSGRPGKINLSKFEARALVLNNLAETAREFKITRQYADLLAKRLGLEWRLQKVSK